MATAETNKEYTTFVRGLITEASPLTFPEGASIDEDNFVLNRDGSRIRRLGIDYENNYAVTSTGILDSVFSTYATSTYRWDNVNNNPLLSIGIIQVGTSLWFVDLSTDNPSANLLNTSLSIDLTGVSSGDTLQYTSINGKLIVSTPEGDLYKLSYDSVTDVVSSETITLYVRDRWGVDDSLDPETFPNTLSDEHHYNLLNQGWEESFLHEYYGISAIYSGWAASTTYYAGRTIVPTSPNGFRYVSQGGLTPTSGSTEPTWPTTVGATVVDNQVTWKNAGAAQGYPNNAQVWWSGKDSTGDFDRDELARVDFGTSLAPRGHFILPFNDTIGRGANREAKALSEFNQTLSLPDDIEVYTFRAVSTFAGRIWYAGLDSSVTGPDNNSPQTAGIILFSQLAVDNDSNINKCYQQADPTAENDSLLVDTDGGFINIPEASRIWKLIEIRGTLVVIAENGIWQVQGGDRGFTATEYSVTKVSSIGAVNAESVVDVEGSILYWSKGGIYYIAYDLETGSLTSSNITESTIQTMYNEISGTAKSFVVGDYDEAAKKVSWLYNDTSNYDGISLAYKYNRELILDLTLQSFYTSTIGELASNTPFVSGYLSTPNYLATSYADPVVVDSDPVTVSGDPVVRTTTIRSTGISDRKYLTFITPTAGNNQTFTLSQFRNGDFVDWEAADTIGIDPPAYLVTGHELLGDTARDKQGRYLVMHFKRTENSYVDDGSGNIVFDDPSSCLIQTRWEWSDHANGRYGPQFQAYRFTRPYISGGIGASFNYGFEVISTKNKIRGKGKSLSFRIDSEAGKNMHILGWSIAYTGNTRV